MYRLQFADSAISFGEPILYVFHVVRSLAAFFLYYEMCGPNDFISQRRSGINENRNETKKKTK